MRAWVIEQHGGPEVFKEVELPTPGPGPGEVRIKVAATSVNPVDCKIRSGAAEALCPPKPAILHGDVSGVVDAVGQGVTWYKPGDHVYGCIGGCGARQGTLADYAIAGMTEITQAPKTIPLEDAASLPLVSITAYEGLLKAGIYDIDDRTHVLVHGGTGGVGHLALQASRAEGARVAATVSSDEKAAIAKQLGADQVINYKEESVEQYTDRLTGKTVETYRQTTFKEEGFDIVFDTIGGPNIATSVRAARHNGQVICIQGRSEIDGSILHAKGISLHLVFMLIPLLHDSTKSKHSQILLTVAKHVADGKIKPLIDGKRFTFNQIGDAHAHAESGKQIGKVLVVHPDHA
ncbi:MAG: zinc-binding dehydrogenase [Phycisphaeraceae bacterium]|nr:zinc-binding dehydrogenase [Phycisphaeraceae bacterium]